MASLLEFHDEIFLILFTKIIDLEVNTKYIDSLYVVIQISDRANPCLTTVFFKSFHLFGH